MICFYATNEGNWYTATDYNKCVDKTWFIRPVVACLPAYLRFAQCLRRYRDTKEKFPHLANAGKYTTTFFVVIFSTLYHTYEADGVDKNSNYPFFYTWIVFSFISSIYAYIWDMKMDWGLFDSNAGDNTLLREEIVYSHVVRYTFNFQISIGFDLKYSSLKTGVLLLWHHWRFCAALRLGVLSFVNRNGLYPRWFDAIHFSSTGSISVRCTGYSFCILLRKQIDWLAILGASFGTFFDWRTNI